MNDFSRCIVNTVDTRVGGDDIFRPIILERLNVTLTSDNKPLVRNVINRLMNN